MGYMAACSDRGDFVPVNQHLQSLVASRVCVLGDTRDLVAGSSINARNEPARFRVCLYSPSKGERTVFGHVDQLGRWVYPTALNLLDSVALVGSVRSLCDRNGNATERELEELNSALEGGKWRYAALVPLGTV